MAGLAWFYAAAPSQSKGGTYFQQPMRARLEFARPSLDALTPVVHLFYAAVTLIHELDELRSKIFENT